MRNELKRAEAKEVDRLFGLVAENAMPLLGSVPLTRILAGFGLTPPASVVDALRVRLLDESMRRAFAVRP